jgi:hypothetical protein
VILEPWCRPQHPAGFDRVFQLGRGRAMKTTGIRHGAAFCISFACALAPVSPHAQENCTPVRFEHGKSSATIRGTAPPDDVVCYTFDAATGQTASLKVAGRNLIISVIGVGDEVCGRPAHAVGY